MSIGWALRITEPSKNLKFADPPREKGAVMQLRNKGSEEIYHVPTGVGKALINAGLAEEVTIQIKKLPDSKWSAQSGRFLQDYECPPFVMHSCSTCTQKSCVGPTNGTAHLTVVRHCGVAETCPADVAEAY